MATKDYIFVASIIINLILGYWIYDMTKDDQEPNKELFKLKGKIEVLESQLLEKDSTIFKLGIKEDSINQLLAAKPKERIVIIDTFDEEAINIISIDTDSSVSILAGRLSKVDLNR